jgi:hypothetical protein
VNRETLGFMLEVVPQSGADERMAEILVSLYATCPPGTGIQWILFGSPHVLDCLSQYGNLRVEDADQGKKPSTTGVRLATPTCTAPLPAGVAHLLQGAHTSLTKGYHYTWRLQVEQACRRGSIDNMRCAKTCCCAKHRPRCARLAAQPRRPHQLVCAVLQPASH